MKKIILSLAIVAAAGAIVVGGSIAYFSDTETSTGNTFTAGTIDIAIDNENPWTSNYNIGDLKPGETGYINFDITNVGQNPVNISKNIGSFVESTGIVSEPECTDQGAVWDDVADACNWTVNSITDTNNIQTQIFYDLSVEVYNSSGTKIWWQTIYKVDGTNDQSLTDIYGDSEYVDLGMIPVGGHMEVTQSYHFNKDAENKYQGDQLSFDITIKADQLAQDASGNATVTLENKSGAPDWAIMSDDNIQGVLTYSTKGATFDYSFTGEVKTTGNYTLIYVGTTGDYPCTGSIVLGTGNFTAGSDKTLSDQVNTDTITDGKVWLIPSNSYDNGVMTSWPQSNILFETGLVNYTKN